MTIYYIFYYAALILFSCFFFLAYKNILRRKIFFSASMISFLLYIVLIGMAGPYISSGQLFGGSFSTELYTLYFFNLAIFPIFLILGNLLGETLIPVLKKRKLLSRFEKMPYLRIKILAAIVFIFVGACVYFTNVSHIPLIELMANPKIDKGLLAAYRNYLTHDFVIKDVSLITNIFLRYETVFLQYFSIIILGIFFYSALIGKRRRDWVIFSVFFFWVSFICLFNLEKAAFISVLVGLLIIYNTAKSKMPIKKFAIFSVFSLAAVLLMYVFFTGSSDIYKAGRNAAERIFLVQSEYSYLHVNKYWSGDLLYGKTFPIMFFDKIFNRKTLNISRLAYRDVSSDYYSQYGITGTTGGLVIANLYMNFGFIFAMIIFSFLVFFVGFFDSIFLYLVGTDFYTPVTISLYSFLSVNFSLAIVMGLDQAFQLPFFFSGGILMVLVFYLFLIFPFKINLKTGSFAGKHE